MHALTHEEESVCVFWGRVNDALVHVLTCTHVVRHRVHGHPAYLCQDEEGVVMGVGWVWGDRECYVSLQFRVQLFDDFPCEKHPSDKSSFSHPRPDFCDG